jgi:ABC-type dipeptide transport system, periplasmic component
MLGYGKLTGAFVPSTFEFALPIEVAPFDPKRAKQLMVEAGYANGFDAGDLTPLPPYASVAEAIAGNLQAIGIRSRVRTMERASFLSAWREKKITGLLIGATGAAGNAAARLEPFFTKNGTYAYGVVPEIEDLFQRQANELDRKKREACSTRSRRSSPIACSWRRSTSRPSPGESARGSRNRRRGSSRDFPTPVPSRT